VEVLRQRFRQLDAAVIFETNWRNFLPAAPGGEYEDQVTDDGDPDLLQSSA
jgi:hypothetical protein